MKMNPERVRIVREMVAETLTSDGGIVIGEKWGAFKDMVLEAQGNENFAQHDVFGLLWDFTELAGKARKLDVEHNTEQVCRLLEALPMAFTVVVKIPGIRVPTGFARDVGNGVVVKASEDARIASGPVISVNGQAVGQLVAILICISAQGLHTNLHGMSSMLDSALMKLRQLVQLFRSSGQFLSAFPGALGKADVYVLDAAGRRFECSAPATLVDYVGALMHRPPAAAPNQVNAALDLAERFFALSPTTDVERVASAMEWLIESEISADQTLGYIAACIGIEALLGEEKDELPTARLQDRYSHLMGGSRTDRRKRAQELKDAFYVRGQLVHARRTQRLRGRELHQLQNVRRILGECLDKELATVLS